MSRPVAQEAVLCFLFTHSLLSLARMLTMHNRVNLVYHPEHSITCLTKVAKVRGWWSLEVPTIGSEFSGVVLAETMILDASWNQFGMPLFPLCFDLLQRFVGKWVRSRWGSRDEVRAMLDSQVQEKPQQHGVVKSI